MTMMMMMSDDDFPYPKVPATGRFGLDWGLSWSYQTPREPKSDLFQGENPVLFQAACDFDTAPDALESQRP